jgi:hypothetical protein
MDNEHRFSSFTMPELSNWQLQVFPKSPRYCVVYRPQKDGEPNWFHRKMQELCFGVKWKYNG